MASKHREEKAIAAVACPTCGAARGEVCRDRDGTAHLQYGRPILCAARRAAWQMIREGLIKDGD